MSIRRLMLTTALLTGFASPLAADVLYEDSHEVLSMMHNYTSRGYTEALFKTYGNEVKQAKKEIICPDYEARTGNKTDCSSLVQIATGMITGGNFNDMISISHLPGDCDDSGCSAQLWSMMGHTWFKRLDFKSSGGVAWRVNLNTETTNFVAVGFEDIPSIHYVWDMSEFKKY